MAQVTVLRSGAERKTAFAEGIRLIFSTWTVLRMAVVHEWGGHESAEKAEWLNNVMVQYFDEDGPRLGADDVMMTLDEIMAREFHIDLREDEAGLRRLSHHVIQLYREVAQGQTTFLNELRSRPLPDLAPVQIEDDDSSDCSNDDLSIDESDAENDLEEAKAYFEEQQQQQHQQQPLPRQVTDEDGWTTVMKPRKR